MIFYLLMIVGIFGIFLMLFARKKKQKSLLSLFQAYNQHQDVGVLKKWLEQGKPSARLTTLLEFLKDIEEVSTAEKLLSSLDQKAIQGRHNLIFATQAFLAANNPLAVPLAEKLLAENPGDDSVLETYLNVQLTIGSLEKAKSLLLPRMKRKFKGTIFIRLYARVLAKDGNLSKAIELMETVVKRDFTLFQNTFASPQKGLIQKQYQESRDYLEQFREQLANSEETSLP